VLDLRKNSKLNNEFCDSWMQLTITSSSTKTKLVVAILLAVKLPRVIDEFDTHKISSAKIITIAPNDRLQKCYFGDAYAKKL
jgi:hypothetical protein